MSNVLLFLLILACPLMMIFMMRGHRGHGHGGHAHGDHGQTAGANGRSDGEHEHDEDCSHDDESLDDLKRSRDELDERIAARELDDLKRSRDELGERIAAREHDERAGVGA